MVVIATINVNGIRAAVRERSPENLGFLHWLNHSGADIVCLQEIRANKEQTLTALAPALADGWQFAFGESKIKGRNGVGILSKMAPDSVSIGFPEDLKGAQEFQDSGRYIEATFNGVRLSNVYIPAGQENTPKQEEKERFTEVLLRYMDQHTPSSNEQENRHLICGDWNIAHTHWDIKNARGNVNKSGFLPSERQWFDQVLAPKPYVQWVDVIRKLYPDTDGPYSFWSPRGRAFENNVGWRIDYHIVTADVAKKVRRGWVDKPASYDARWSDHAPVLVDYEMDF